MCAQVECDAKRRNVSPHVRNAKRAAPATSSKQPLIAQTQTSEKPAAHLNFTTKNSQKNFLQSCARCYRILKRNADMAQLVEHHLAKVGVAGSNPVVRSIVYSGWLIRWPFFKCAPRLSAMRSAEMFRRMCETRSARRLQRAANNPSSRKPKQARSLQRT